MLVIPAIDLKDGRCVRLVEGRADSATEYDLDPLAAARAYEEAGAQLIHVVDLDGAFRGAASENQNIIRQLARATHVPIEVGGGVRSLADIKMLITSVGARYVVVGTLAVERPDLVEAALSRFGDAVVIGIDARANDVATRGWTEMAPLTATGLARRTAEMGASRIIYTDIARDGRLIGPNIEMTRQVARAAQISVTASGGVGSLQDICRLCAIEADGVDSVIVGKALYEKRFSLEEALEAASRGSSMDVGSGSGEPSRG